MKCIKTFAVAAIVVMLTASGCSKTPQVSEDNAEALKEATKEELEQAVSDRDELLSLVNDISDGLNQIKTLEGIVAVGKAETPNQKQQIRQDIASIQEALEQRKQRLEELEKKLSSSKMYTNKLQSTITSLKNQIEEQRKEIERLTGELASANERIGVLGNQVDSLTTTVAGVTDQRDEARRQATDLTNELNFCYYAIGSDKELKEHNIVQGGGFLRKSKLMEGEFDQAFFTKSDKRSLSRIPLYAKKAEVLTKQPKDSYVIEDENGSKVLRITNAEKFWKTTNYLVVKVK